MHFLLRALQVLFYSTNAILLPYLPLLLQHRGFSPAETGTLLMLGPFLAMFIQPLVGIVSDKLKAIKPVLLILWTALGSSAVVLFITEQQLTVALSLLAVYIFFQPTVSMLDTLMVKSSRTLKVSYSSLRMWGSVGFMATLLVLGQTFEAWGGLDSLLLMFAPIWIGVCLLFILLRDPGAETVQKQAERKLDIGMLRKTLSDPALLLFLSLMFLIAVPHRMNDGLLSLHLQHIGASSSQVSWAWAVAGAGEIAGFIVMARWKWHNKILSMLTAASVLYAVRWLLYAIVTDPDIVVMLQVSHAFTFVAVWVLGIEYVARTLPKHLLATGQALFSMVFLGLGGLAGGSIGGILQQYAGEGAMYRMGIICCLAAGIGFFIWSRRASNKQVALDTADM